MQDEVFLFDIILHIGGEAVKIEELHLKGEVAFDKNIVELRQYFWAVSLSQRTARSRSEAGR